MKGTTIWDEDISELVADPYAGALCSVVYGRTAQERFTQNETCTLQRTADGERASLKP